MSSEGKGELREVETTRKNDYHCVAIEGSEQMPEISRFFGMIIRMMYDDHAPPHFHVIYNEFEAMIGISDLRLLEGDLPPKAFALVMEWAKLHQDELLKDWDLAKSQKQTFKIEPLR